MNIKKGLIGCILLSLVQLSSGATFGSDTSVRRFKTRQTLREKDIIAGFAELKGGFKIYNAGTVALFDSVMPVEGDIDLNGGALIIDSDMVLRNGATISRLGNIIGGHHALDFSSTVTALTYPIAINSPRLNYICDQSFPDDIHSSDWSYDDKYLIVGLDSNSTYEIGILSFTSHSLNLLASKNMSQHVYSVRWHPSAYYCAAVLNAQGSGAIDELVIYEFDPTDDSLTQVDGVSLDKTQRDIAWSPDGAYLAVARQDSSNELAVYSFSEGTLGGSPVTANLNPNRTIRTLAWDSTGGYLAAGTTRSGSGEELLVFSFNGSTLTEVAQKEIGREVRSLSWRSDSDYIAVGIVGGGDRIKVYEFDSGGNTLTERVSVSTTQDVYSVHWCPNGSQLAVGARSWRTAAEFFVYEFETATPSLTLIHELEAGRHVEAVRWSHDGKYLVRGDTSNRLYMYMVAQGFIFQDLALSLESNLSLESPIIFCGDCMLDGHGYALDMALTASMIIGPGATLTCKDITIKNVHDTNIQYMSNTSKLKQQNVIWIQDDDYVMNDGRFELIGNWRIRGQKTFAYQSGQQSKIGSQSILYLDKAVTFSYAPPVADHNLLAMEDESSCISLRNASLHTTTTGLHFTKGTIKVRGLCELVSDATVFQEALVLGNGVQNDDVTIEIMHNSTLKLTQGILAYNNLNPLSLDMINENSRLHFDAGTMLIAYQNIPLGSGALTLGEGVTIARSDDAEIVGSVYPLGAYVYTTTESLQEE